MYIYIYILYIYIYIYTHNKMVNILTNHCFLKNSSFMIMPSTIINLSTYLPIYLSIYLSIIKKEVK